MDLEQNILQIIRGEKKAPFLKSVFAGLSYLYRNGIAARNWAYDNRIFRSKRLSTPVISIGNLVVGGTGKTPLVHLLVSSLQEKAKVAILTRGFRSRIEKSGTVQQISCGEGPLFSPEECGDEPYFLAQKTKAAVWVGVDRHASGQEAIRTGAKCLILDDGFQHRRLERDFEIVVIDGSDPFSRGRFLPWGLLRDSPKRLKGAHLIVATHIKNQDHYFRVQRQLSSWTSAPLIGVQIEVLNKTAFPPRKVGLFCGIGQPSHFLQTARDLNQEIVDTFFVKDHGSFSREELHFFAERCRQKGAEALLCTEKDYVKLSGNSTNGLPIVPVEIRLQVTAGKEHWENCIKNILDKVVT